MGHSELVLEHVTKEDSGTYTCVAENNAGTIKSVAFVYVKGAHVNNSISLCFSLFHLIVFICSKLTG